MIISTNFPIFSGFFSWQFHFSQLHVFYSVFLFNITDEKLFILISTDLNVLYEIYEIRKESLESICKEEIQSDFEFYWVKLHIRCNFVC